MSTMTHEFHSYTQTHAHTNTCSHKSSDPGVVAQHLGGMLRQEDCQEFEARLDYVSVYQVSHAQAGHMLSTCPTEALCFGTCVWVSLHERVTLL